MTLCSLGAAGVEAPLCEPLTLAQLVQMASTNNPDATLAEIRVRRAGALLTQADSAIWPKVQAQSSYMRTDHPVSVFGAALNQRSFSPALNFNDVPDADNFNIRGVASVPLYTGGRIRAQRDMAQAHVSALRKDAETVRNELALEVVRTFHMHAKALEFIRAAESAVAAFRENLSIAQRRMDAGTSLKTDVLDIEVSLLQAGEDLVRAQNARLLALKAMANLVGNEDGGIVISADGPAPEVPAEGSASVRPEVQALLARERSAEAALRQARAGARPRVTAFASVDQDHGWVFNGSNTSYGGGLMAQWDLWDGHLNRGRVAEALAELDAVRAEMRRTRLAIGLEADQARLRMIEANERVKVTLKAVELARESVALTRSRYEQGLSLAAQLIDAENALTAARVRHAEARAEEHVAIASLRKALGLPQAGGKD